MIKSILLCESLVINETNAKKGSDSEISVTDDSILTPQCVFNGKWILNGDSISYHRNIMQENSVIHVFSTNDKDEKAINFHK